MKTNKLVDELTQKTVNLLQSVSFEKLNASNLQVLETQKKENEFYIALLNGIISQTQQSLEILNHKDASSISQVEKRNSLNFTRRVLFSMQKESAIKKHTFLHEKVREVKGIISVEQEKCLFEKISDIAESALSKKEKCEKRAREIDQYFNNKNFVARCLRQEKLKRRQQKIKRCVHAMKFVAVGVFLILVAAFLAYLYLNREYRLYGRIIANFDVVESAWNRKDIPDDPEYTCPELPLINLESPEGDFMLSRPLELTQKMHAYESTSYDYQPYLSSKIFVHWKVQCEYDFQFEDIEMFPYYYLTFKMGNKIRINTLSLDEIKDFSQKRMILGYQYEDDDSN